MSALPDVSQSEIDRLRIEHNERRRAPALPCQGVCSWCNHQGAMTVRVTLEQEKTPGETYEFDKTECYLAWHDARSAD